MQKKYHFISGLPRSGSTLLTAILKQNPRFHSEITDSLCNDVINIINSMSNVDGMSHYLPTERRRDAIQGYFDGYYKCVQEEVVFNTNRSWTYLIHNINYLYPGSKIIACVRDVNLVLNSFELARLKNPLSVSPTVGNEITTVYRRTNELMMPENIVGLPYYGLKQALAADKTNTIILIEYDDLCKNPEETIRSIYTFIDEPCFAHDFNNIKTYWAQYDKELKIELHTVREKVEYKPVDIVLPPEVFQQYSNMEFWRG